MTEKRFKPHLFDDGVNERYFDGIIDNEDDNEVIVNYQYISNLLNHLYEENNQLREIIKLSHYNEICEHCKYAEYWITQDYWSGGKEGNFRCHKGHPSEDCCDIQECSDYELKDLKELLKEYKND